MLHVCARRQIYVLFYVQLSCPRADQIVPAKHPCDPPLAFENNHGGFTQIEA